MSDNWKAAFVLALLVGSVLLFVAFIHWLFTESPEHFAKRKAEWVGNCRTLEFSPVQCEALFSITENVRQAQESADAAGVAAGIAIGASAGRK